MEHNALPRQLLAELETNAAVQKLNREKSPLPYTSYIQEALVIAASYRKKKRAMLVVKHSLYSAQRLFDRLSALLDEGECVLFGADESLRVEAIAQSPEMTARKVDALSSLLKDPEQVVITCPSGILRQLPLPETFAGACMHIRTGDTLEMKELRQRLLAGGYFQTSHIDQPLSFAARGGIIDVYSINYDNPIRVEFFDNEVDSIRFFDAETQKTIVPVQEVEIVPASDILFSESDVEEIEKEARRILKEQDDPLMTSSVETALDLITHSIREPGLYPYYSLVKKTACVADYMKDPLMIICDENGVRESIRRFQEETVSYIQEMVQEKKLLPRFALFHDFDRIACRKRIAEDPLSDNLSNIISLHLPEESLPGRLNILSGEARVLFALGEKEYAVVMNACTEGHHPYTLLTDGMDRIPTGFSFSLCEMPEGFTLADAGITVVTGRELFGTHRVSGRYEKKFHSAEVIHSYDELEPGDYVVHASYGVGQYVGIETREVQNVMRDFLRVIYKGNAELLVPLDQFRLVRKFVSREGIVPKLNKLGSGDWEKTRARLEENVSDLAERLVKLYSAREEHIGHAYQKDSELQKEFEKRFMYDLTPDQETAVADVKKDMESDRPMDRLVCGDVGFGKTEIAVRAAFKAASENKQVAVLCPTTILAEQHFHTFSERFEGYPFTIAVLDRFVSAGDVKKTLKDLKDGKVDVLIGTHRILSKDVEFHDLGLLVVDEEQRFGVEHKEKIKELKTGIDVLTLSATPIPRTLQMSLVGIRSLSQLETPPSNRYNVQTYVAEKNQGLIVDAIEKELARDGQVFYLYNSIDSIYNTARTLQSLIPDARIGIVHGRMNREDIETVMFRFTKKELNVLVCTTIIENGIDIPNANTMIIDNAQNFGLAQIYQIKGRVGRSDRVAYAYLLVPPQRTLNETAQKRLQAVKEFAKLGSGYRIAMRDLTIRGAGDLLGPDQSGFIDTVGIDMYIEMLEEAIEKTRGTAKEKPPELKHTNISKSGYIPKEFAPDDFDKISMYQKIDQLNSFEELEAYRTEVSDEYGSLPEEVRSLFEKRKLDILVNDRDVDSCREIRDRVQVTFSRLFSQKIDGVKLFQIFSDISKDIELRYTNSQIIASLPKSRDSLALTIEMILRSKEAVRNEN